MDMSLSRLWELVTDREAWGAAVDGVTKRWTWLSNWTKLMPILFYLILCLSKLGFLEWSSTYRDHPFIFPHLWSFIWTNCWINYNYQKQSTIKIIDFEGLFYKHQWSTAASGLKLINLVPVLWITGKLLKRSETLNSYVWTYDLAAVPVTAFISFWILDTKIFILFLLAAISVCLCFSLCLYSSLFVFYLKSLYYLNAYTVSSLTIIHLHRPELISAPNKETMSLMIQWNYRYWMFMVFKKKKKI